MNKKIVLTSFILTLFVNFNSFADEKYTIVNETDQNVVLNFPYCGNAKECSIDAPANKVTTGKFVSFLPGGNVDVVPDKTDKKGKSCKLPATIKNMGVDFKIRKSKLSLSGNTITCDATS